MEQIFPSFIQVIKLLLDSSSTAALLIVGILLLIFAGLFILKAVKSKPKEITFFQKIALSVCLVAGVIFSAAGPSLALFYVSQDPIRKTPFEDAFSNLIQNKRVRYAIRLITYNPSDLKPTPSIDRLQQLGPPKQKYSFVADYEELKGYTVKEALDLFGIGYISGYHVSAIIFPVHVDLYPANARGLLQVVSKVEEDVDPNNRIMGPGKLNQAELDEFEDIDIPSYRIENFKTIFPRYCELAKTFFCGRYPAKELIGGLYRDWHPLGFSQKNPPARPCAVPTDRFCAFSDWDTARQELKARFGVRAFLIENLEINKIPGRMLFNFQDPLRDRIPELGLAPSF
jgi:hypothetical protein